MNTSIKRLAVCGCVLAVAGSIQSVQAGITETENLGLTWQGTPTYLVAAGANPGSFTVGENNYNAGGAGGAGGFGALSQSFTLSPSQAGTLSTIQLVLGGASSSGSPNTFDVELIDLGPYPASGYPATSASYNPTSLGSMLSSGLSFNYAGTAGTSANVVQLTFSGTDAVTLNAGELYAFQIDPMSSPSGGQTVWYRGNLGGPGQEYRMNQFTSGSGVMGAINGLTRDASFALTTTPVPEPTTLVLVGLGGLASLVALRRKK